MKISIQKTAVMKKTLDNNYLGYCKYTFFYKVATLESSQTATFNELNNAQPWPIYFYHSYLFLM